MSGGAPSMTTQLGACVASTSSAPLPVSTCCTTAVPSAVAAGSPAAYSSVGQTNRISGASGMLCEPDRWRRWIEVSRPDKIVGLPSHGVRRRDFALVVLGREPLVPAGTATKREQDDALGSFAGERRIPVARFNLVVAVVTAFHVWGPSVSGGARCFQQLPRARAGRRLLRVGHEDDRFTVDTGLVAVDDRRREAEAPAAEVLGDFDVGRDPVAEIDGR